MAGSPIVKTEETAQGRKSLKVQQTKKALIEAMQKNLGVVSAACQAVGVDRSTFYLYSKTDPEFAQSVKDVEEYALDFVESQAYKQIKEGNTSMIIFYLKTKGKRRGYIERQEVEHSGGIAVEQITGMEVK